MPGREAYENRGVGRRPKKAARLVAGLVAASCLGLVAGMPLAEAVTSTPPAALSSSTSQSAVQSKGVVLINTVLPNGTGAGTGMVVSSSGIVLTNYHVVEGSTQVKVTIADSGQTYAATVLGHDASKDVAVLQLQGASGLATVTVATTAVSDGEPVTAVGNANGQQYLSAVSGQVTAPTAQVTAADEVNPGQSETLTDVFETNVAVASGDSGGPMYNSAGEVVGMTTAGSQSSGGGHRLQSSVALADSYAVNIGEAETVVRQVETGAPSGTTQVGPNAYLGVMIDTSQGTLTVAGIQPGTPAANAGLQAGDTITSIGSTTVSNNTELSTALRALRPGAKVRIGWTDASGATHSAAATLAASPVN